MKSLAIFSILSCSILFIAFNSANKEKATSPLIITTVGDTPVLPDEPYKYGFSFPKHIVQVTPNSGGYGSSGGGIDTTILPLIDPNVATLGRVLFYDKVLSANEDISCGSCHIQSKSFADNKPLSTGVFIPTKRNSMQLNDLGWSNTGEFFWDVKTSSLSHAIKLPLTDDNEIGATMADIEYKMSNSSYYPGLFRKAFGDENPTESRVIKALEQFIISINTTNSKFDQIMSDPTKSFSSSEERGRKLFANDCSGCHVQGENPFRFMNIKDKSEITYNGYEDKNGDKGHTQNIVNLQPLFKMPTLRNIEHTAPYMHDGNVPTLDSLINFYSDGVQETNSSLMEVGGFKYNAQQKEDLKAFLLTLTDENTLTNIKWSDPFSIVNTVDLQAEVKVFPNPSYDYANIVIKDKEGKRKDITITDASGRVIDRDYFTNDTYKVNVSDYRPGIYMLRIAVGNELGVYKLMIQ